MIIDAREAREMALRHIKAQEYLTIISDEIFKAASRGKFEYTYKISKDSIGNLVVSDICTILGNNNVGSGYFPFGYKTSWELTSDGFYLIHISWKEDIDEMVQKQKAETN